MAAINITQPDYSSFFAPNFEDYAWNDNGTWLPPMQTWQSGGSNPGEVGDPLWQEQEQEYGFVDKYGNVFDMNGLPIDSGAIEGMSYTDAGEGSGGAPGENPGGGYWPGQRPRASATSRPGMNQPFYNIGGTDKLENIGVEDRLASYNWLHGMDQSLFDRTNADADLENYFTDQMFSGPGGYDRILAGQGGYTPEEIAAIKQESLYRGAMAAPEDLDQFALKDWEEQQIAGNPHSVLDNAIPVTAQAQDAFNESSKWRRQSYGKDLKDPLLGLSEDADALEISDEFKDDFQPITGIADQAARNNMLKATARNDELVRSTANGVISPLALNAARARNVIYGDVAAEDAYANAQLQEDMANRDLAARLEQFRREGVANRIGTKSGLHSTVGTTGMGLEADLAREYQDINRWGGEWLGSLGQQAEAASANRATGAAAMRRENLGRSLDTKFSQGLGVGDRFSSTSKDAATARRGDETEARGTMGKLQSQYSDRGLAGGQQRINAFTTGTNAAKNAADTLYREKSLPKVLDKIIAAGSAAAMAAAGAG